MYDYEFPRAMVAATVVPFYEYDNKLMVVLGRRGKDVEASPGELCAPGGFMDVDRENVKQAAVRELKEEINAEITKDDLELFTVASEPSTDPRGHVVNVCYWVHLMPHDVVELKAGDDIEELWFGTADDVPELAFDHNHLVKLAIDSWDDHNE